MSTAGPGTRNDDLQDTSSCPDDTDQNKNDYHLMACRFLRAALPSYDSILEVLESNGAWWNSFCQKTQLISQGLAIEPLAIFAARAYTSTSPSEVGALAVAYARSLGTYHDILQLVENTVISDYTFISTIKGLECVILLGKTYTDIGQPRRAWLVWRKGMAIAQLMVYRICPTLHRIFLTKSAGLAYSQL